MELTAIRRTTSPGNPGSVRLTGLVRTAAGEASEWWIEVAEEIAGDLSASGDPWLAWLLPAAAALREPLAIRLPVDGLFLERTRELLEIWRLWDARFAVVDVRAEAQGGAPVPGRGRTAALFSGGVDSIFTALRPRHAPIDDLLLVRGSVDLPIDDAARFEGARASVERLARSLGRSVLHVAMNFYEQHRRLTDRRRHAFSPALCGVALALAPRLERLLFPATLDAAWLPARQASHPCVDILHSTRGLRIDVDGVGARRVDKVRAIVEAPEAEVILPELRVCFQTADGRNCSR